MASNDDDGFIDDPVLRYMVDHPDVYDCGSVERVCPVALGTEEPTGAEACLAARSCSPSMIEIKRLDDSSVTTVFTTDQSVTDEACEVVVFVRHQSGETTQKTCGSWATAWNQQAACVLLTTQDCRAMPPTTDSSS